MIYVIYIEGLSQCYIKECVHFQTKSKQLKIMYLRG